MPVSRRISLCLGDIYHPRPYAAFVGCIHSPQLNHKSLQVCLGKVRWLAPTGLMGLTPVASIGPVEVGPSSLEGSSAVLPEVLVRLDPLQSLLKRKLMLQLQADKAQVYLLICRALGLDDGLVQRALKVSGHILHAIWEGWVLARIGYECL